MYDKMELKSKFIDRDSPERERLDTEDNLKLTPVIHEMDPDKKAVKNLDKLIKSKKFPSNLVVSVSLSFLN